MAEKCFIKSVQDPIDGPVIMKNIIPVPSPFENRSASPDIILHFQWNIRINWWGHISAQSKAKQSKAKQSKAKQSKAKQSKAKQSKAKQSKAKQSKAKQSKAKQSKAK